VRDPSLRSRLAVAAAGWLLAAVALPVSVAAGGPVAFAAELVFLAPYVTALVLTAQLLRSRVPITVTAGEVRVGDVRLPRTNLTLTVEPDALLVQAAGRDPVRLVTTRRRRAEAVDGVRVDLGGVVVDVGFPEPAGATDPAPMMPMPRWMTEPGEGDRLVRALARP
jgi:Protein of unknown function (DUF3093)